MLAWVGRRMRVVVCGLCRGGTGKVPAGVSRWVRGRQAGVLGVFVAAPASLPPAILNSVTTSRAK